MKIALRRFRRKLIVILSFILDLHLVVCLLLMCNLTFYINKIVVGKKKEYLRIDCSFVYKILFQRQKIIFRNSSKSFWTHFANGPLFSYLL